MRAERSSRVEAKREANEKRMRFGDQASELYLRLAGFELDG